MKNIPLLCFALSLLGACSDEPAKPPPRTALLARTDRERLASHLKLPAFVHEVRWLVMPVGDPDGMLAGPTDTILWAYLALDEAGWQALKSSLPFETRRNVSIPTETARALGLVSPPFTASGEQTRADLEVLNADALAKPHYASGGSAAKVPGGIVLWASSN